MTELSRKTSGGLALLALGLVLTAAGCQGKTPSQPEKTKPAESAKESKPAESAKPSKAETTQAVSKALTAREVLDRMGDAYRKASTYADAGTVRLLIETKGKQPYEDQANFSLTLERPNKVRILAYRGMLTCDGRQLCAAIENVPNQVLVRPAPEKLTIETLDIDAMLMSEMTQGIAGPMPQWLLLFADDPIGKLLHNADEPTLAEPGTIDGRRCHRVRIRWGDETAVFWIDRETYVLRRIEEPTEELRRDIAKQEPVDKVTLTAEFDGARFDETIDPKAFAFEMPAGTEIVKYFVPPQLTAQLRKVESMLGRRPPPLRFVDFDDKPFTDETAAGKVNVFVFWSSTCPACLKYSLPDLKEKIERYRDNPKVAFYAVSLDGPNVENKKLAEILKNMKVDAAILRDPKLWATDFGIGSIPVVCILDDKGIVQYFEEGFHPDRAKQLPEIIDGVLAGENLAERILRNLRSQIDEFRRYAERTDATSEVKAPAETAPANPPIDAARSIPDEVQIPIPDAEIAPRSEPAALKLAPLWKCDAVKSPGNILVLSDQGKSDRIAVVENWNSIAELDADGKLLALHKLNLAEGENIGSLRSAVAADGRRYIVAWMSGQQRCHVLDDNWQHVVSYPEDALQHPHAGIADALLGDLDGEGPLKLYVGYWGAVGVQAASLDGKRLWANRSLSNALSIALGPADAKGRRLLYSTGDRDALILIDAKGQRQSSVQISGKLLRKIVSADLRGDGQLLWCGLSAMKLGEDVAIGLTPEGSEQWSYPMPRGVHRQPIETIIAGKITRDGPGQWILPGSDGSIHFLSADGKPLDRFNYGAALHGLATIAIDGRPVLLVASANGLEARRVENP